LFYSKGAKLEKKPLEDPLLVAPAWLGDYEMCRLLVEQRVDLRETTRIEGNTPLLQVHREEEHEECVEREVKGEKDTEYKEDSTRFSSSP